MLEQQRLHVCCDEAPTWVELVEAAAAELRACGLELPAVRLAPTKLSPLVSVDVGALDGAAARRCLSPWRPAPLRESLAETVRWWVDGMRARAEADGDGGGGGGGSKRGAAAAALGDEAAVGASSSDFRFGFE